MVRNNPERPIQALLAICSLVLLLAVATAFLMEGQDAKAADQPKANTVSTN